MPLGREELLTRLRSLYGPESMAEAPRPAPCSRWRQMFAQHKLDVGDFSDINDIGDIGGLDDGPKEP